MLELITVHRGKFVININGKKMRYAKCGSSNRLVNRMQ